MKALHKSSHLLLLFSFLLMGTLFGGCAVSDKLAARFMEDFQELKRTLKNPEDASWENLKTVTIRCLPETVRPGEEIKMESEYSVRPSGLAETMTVRETWNLKREGQILYTLKKETKSLEKGTYQVQGRLVLPRDILPGSYNIEHKVETCPFPEKTATVHVTQECTFRVVP